MACERCAKRVRAFCKARWARLRVHGAGSVHRPSSLTTSKFERALLALGVAATPRVIHTRPSAAARDRRRGRLRSPRDEHFNQVIQREVVAQNRKALLIFGGGHLYRHWWNPFSDNRRPQNLIDLLEQRAPGSVFIVMVHAFVERHAALEQQLAAWPKPAAMLLKGTWLGETSTDPVMETSVERGFPDGTVARAKVNPYLGLKLQDLADGYLYLGDMDSLTASVPSANDPEYVRPSGVHRIL